MPQASYASTAVLPLACSMYLHNGFETPHLHYSLLGTVNYCPFLVKLDDFLFVSGNATFPNSEVDRRAVLFGGGKVADVAGHVKV